MENLVILVGNLGADPEVRAIANGNSVCNMRIATSHRRKVGEQWQDETEWHTVVCFGRTAENCGQYLRKGRQVFVKGRLQSRDWEDRDGNKRRTTEVVAHEVKFIGGKAAGDSPHDNYAGKTRPMPRTRSNDPEPDSDIPF